MSHGFESEREWLGLSLSPFDLIKTDNLRGKELILGGMSVKTEEVSWLIEDFCMC